MHQTLLSLGIWWEGYGRHNWIISRVLLSQRGQLSWKLLAWNLSAATGRQGWVLPGISCRQFTRFKCQLQSGKNFLALNLLVCICVLADNVVFSKLVYWEISLVPEGVRNWGWEQPGGDIKAWGATLLPPMLSLYCLCMVTHASGVKGYFQNTASQQHVFQATL